MELVLLLLIRFDKQFHTCSFFVLAITGINVHLEEQRCIRLHVYFK